MVINARLVVDCSKLKFSFFNIIFFFKNFKAMAFFASFLLCKGKVKKTSHKEFLTSILAKRRIESFHSLLARFHPG